jgi:polysaccharide deacetylase family protein (PEP-CTERM system associated)
MTHHFTVDVEEYFQVSALEPHVARERWDDIPARIEIGTDLLLGLLDEVRVRGTFFVLGWIAERHPATVLRIAAAGHEVASHGWGHRRVTDLSPQRFRASVRRSKLVLEDLVGQPVQGYRAPSFSIVPGLEWALDVLVEEGYRYDSSLFPVQRQGYGFPGAHRDPHWLKRAAGQLAQFPPATLRVAGRNLPAGGGGYFRLLPYAFVREAFSDADRRGVSATFYIHPWELDPQQPRLDVPLSTRIRHYGGLQRTVPRLRRLLAEFGFGAIADTLASEEAACPV